MRFEFLPIFFVQITSVSSIGSAQVPFPRAEQGLYRVNHANTSSSTCPSSDHGSIGRLPFWSVRTFGSDLINIRESLNLSHPTPETERFGYFPLRYNGYGAYKGSGWLTFKRNGKYGPCTLRRDIEARVDAFTGGALLLQATVKQKYMNPEVDGHYCYRNEIFECEWTFQHDLSLESRNADP